MAIKKKTDALNKKFMKDLRWDDEGLEMWKVGPFSMDDAKYAQIKQKDQVLQNDWNKFMEETGASIDAEFADLGNDVEVHVHNIEDRITQTKRFFNNPKYN